MDILRIQGGKTLKGTIHIGGAKNAALPLLCVPLLTSQPITFHNVPHLQDIQTMMDILIDLGCYISTKSQGYQESPYGRSVTITCPEILHHQATYDLIKTMRAGILVLGPLLARTGKAIVSLPGGCAIGARPVDIHIDGMKALGADIEVKNGYIYANAPNGLIGNTIDLPFASVGATENLIMAASLAKGTTILNNAAREPEIVDLAVCLNRAGAKISGAGTSTITIIGVSTLKSTSHPIMYDRIEAGTYALLGAMIGDALTLKGFVTQDNEVLFELLQQSGAQIQQTSPDSITVSAPLNGQFLKAQNVKTEPYPGFPTDLQAQYMAAMCFADHPSMITENIFENRFMHVPELCRMNADITINGNQATITPTHHLSGAEVMATDLRASVSLVIAALVANGKTTINRLYHLDRGYERLDDKLLAVGADIIREQQQKTVITNKYRHNLITPSH
ncbi:MAG: UDP-N-acetylglucosamine 1-carboxyvinyltransferase [Alphaproteobacteria bacterium]|jgi:UDP-N-acetylglucosamine 1-carboxyvinyltransferase